MLDGTGDSLRSKVSRPVVAILLVCVAGYLAGSLYFYISAGRLAARATVLALRGDTDSARESLETLLWFHPYNPDANLAIGKVELKVGALEKAIRYFRAVPPESRLHQKASYELAKTLALDGQLTAAEAELEVYLLEFTPTEQLWNLYFRLLYLQARTRDVVRLFERKYSSGDGLVSDAKFFLKAEHVPQEPRQTLKLLSSICSRHPRDVNSRVALAIALERTNESSKGISLLRDIVREHPDHDRARITLSRWLASRQEFRGARDVLWTHGTFPDVDATEIETIHSDDRYWSLSSQLAEQESHLDRALEYIDRALQIRSGTAKYLSQKGQILRQLSRVDDANVAAEQALKSGETELELFLLARELEHKELCSDDCNRAALLYGRLGRADRVKLWSGFAERLRTVEHTLHKEVVTP